MNGKSRSNGSSSEEEEGLSRVERGRKNRNPYIMTMKEDRLYHIGLVSGPQDMKEMFGDVKVGRIIIVIYSHYFPEKAQSYLNMHLI